MTNILTLELRSFNPSRKGSATNEGGVGNFTPQQRPLSDRKKEGRSLIYEQISTK